MTPPTLKPGWKTVKIGDVVALNRDRVADPAADGIERYVGLEHITPEDLRIRSWGLVAEGTTFTNYFQPGQVLFGKRRAYQRKVAVADFSGVCSGDIYVLEPKEPTVLLPELLPFICQTEGFYEHAVGTSAGSLSPRTNWTQLSKYKFPLPPLDEQRRIVEILSSADQLVCSLMECLSSANSLLASIRKSEFDPEKYSPCLLSELCSDGAGIKIGPFGAQLHQSDYVEEGIPVVMPANMNDETIETSNIARISEEKANELQIHRIICGDILLPRRGELDRRAFVEKENEGWLCGTGSLRIRVDKTVSSKAIFHALSSSHSVRWLIGNAVGTTMLNLNSKIVARIPIALPPEPRRTEIIEKLTILKKQIGVLEIRLNKAQEMKKKLLLKTHGV